MSDTAGPAVVAPAPDGEGAGRQPGGRAEPRLVVLTLLVILFAVTCLNSFGRTPVDIKPEVYLAPWRTAVSYLSSWQSDPQLGYPSFNVGLAPVAVVVGVLQSVGFSAGASAHVLRGVLAALLGWGVARLYRAVVPRSSTTGALAAAVLAVANPYTLVAGSTLAIALPLAILPWQLLATVHAVRTGGWRWPAVVALTFLAMSGMNAGVIPMLQGLAVPVVAALTAVEAGLGWRRVLAVLGRCAVLCLLVSAYWLVPAFSALGSGTTVTANSETVSGIAGPTSFAEVVRGLGIWPLYGSDSRGPWQPQFAAYLDNPLVVLASFALPALLAAGVLLVRGPARRFGLWLVVPAVVVMVGVHPPSAPSPFGRLLRMVFEVPATSAFRTTNKIGAVLVVGGALLGAAAWAALMARSAPRSRPYVVLGAAVLLVGATLPAWQGRLYTSFVDVPAYWRQAASALDDGSSQRVWLVPGEVQSRYRWSDSRPDDVSLSLLRRPSLVRTVIPVTGAAAANLLAAVDTGLQEGSLAPGTLAAAARYLGVDTVLLRNDQAWEDDSGARPQVLQDVIEADPGLLPVRNYGGSGEHVVPVNASITPLEAALPPLQQWSVTAAVPVVHAEPMSGGVLVAGDGYALDALVAAGLVDGRQSVRYLGEPTSATPSAVEQALAAGTRLVLTDTNRRRTTVAGRLTDGQGPLVTAAQDPGDTRVLGAVRDQTALVDEGGTVTATRNGSVFGPLPYSTPENAVDGDPDTYWEFGDFSTGVGTTLTVRFSERAVPSVTVHSRTTDAVRISRVRIALDGERGSMSTDMAVDGSGAARWVLPRTARGHQLTVTVLATTGQGFNRLAIGAVDVPGLMIRRVATLPTTLDTLAGTLSGPGRARLTHTPLDVLLTRVRGTASTTDDEEQRLDRSFTLPTIRRYRLSAVLRVSGPVPDSALDALAGADRQVSATASSRLFDRSGVRASQAVDGNPQTAWIPSAPVVGQSLTVRAPSRRISRITVTQTRRAGAPADWASRIRVSLDGAVVAESDARLGTTVVPVPPQDASRVRVDVLATASGRSATEVRIAEVGFGGARVRFDAGRAARACLAVGTVDGASLRVHPTTALDQGADIGARSCGTRTLTAGRHEIRAGIPGVSVDRLTLSDTVMAVTAPGGTPALTVEHGRPTDYRIHTRGGSGPFHLVLGQSFDPRWHASVDGRELGPPELLDGWSVGWRIPGGTDHVVSVRYGPQHAADVALVVSAVAVLGCTVLATGGAAWFGSRWGSRLRRRRRPGPVAVAASPSTTADRERVAIARRSWFWPVAVVLAAVFGGVPAAVAAAAAAGWQRVGRPDRRWFAATGAALLAVVPVLWWVLRPADTRIGPQLVLDNPWPGYATAAGLVFLVLAAASEDGARR